MPNYVIFAGVNGAGKSTLYKTIVPALDLGVRINTDEIVKSIGDWRNNKDQIKAGRMALKIRKDCINNMISFNQETTFTGKNIIKAINEAKEKGFTIHLYYVGVDTPEIAKQRVRNRVLKGGHDIPDDIIEKRYYETLENLKTILPKVDYAKIYDNSEKYKLYCSKFHSSYKILYKNLPKWLENILKEIIKNK